MVSFLVSGLYGACNVINVSKDLCVFTFQEFLNNLGINIENIRSLSLYTWV